MSLPEILKIAAALATALFGLYALARPKAAAALVSIDASSKTGAAEMRIAWGGVFIALGLGVIIINAPKAYLLLGLAYAGAAVVRIVSLLMDSALMSRIFTINLIFEIVSAVIFFLP